MTAASLDRRLATDCVRHATSIAAILLSCGVAMAIATLVGHSLGSFVAQVVAQNDGDRRIARLVLVGSGIPSATSSGAISRPERRFAPLPPAFLETMIAEVQRAPAALFPEVAAGSAAAEHVDRLRRLTVPTLVAWGDRDQMMSRADQADLVAIIPGARLITFANTGHALHGERPVRFARELTAVVDSRGP